MEFIKQDNKVYKIMKIEVSKELRLKDIDEEMAKLQEEKRELEKIEELSS